MLIRRVWYVCTRRAHPCDTRRRHRPCVAVVVPGVTTVTPSQLLPISNPGNGAHHSTTLPAIRAGDTPGWQSTNTHPAPPRACLCHSVSWCTRHRAAGLTHRACSHVAAGSACRRLLRHLTRSDTQAADAVTPPATAPDQRLRGGVRAGAGKAAATVAVVRSSCSIRVRAAVVIRQRQQQAAAHSRTGTLLLPRLLLRLRVGHTPLPVF